MDIFSAIVLGFVQGVTEFLPVSSTGHLILVRSIFGIEDGNGLAFDAVLHLATASAVVVYFFDEIWMLLQTILRVLGKLPVNKKDVTLIQALVVASIPAVILGLFLEDIMGTLFRHPLLVAGVLIFGSGLFIFAEYKYQNSYRDGVVDIPTGFKIGLFQTLALIPGMSRSGATISGGMLLGLTRAESAKFAFLMAIPIMLGAGTKKLLELITAGASVSWLPIIIGSITAFIVGLLAIHFMITFVKKHTLWPFIWYRIVLATFIIFVVFFG